MRPLWCIPQSARVAVAVVRERNTLLLSTCVSGGLLAVLLRRTALIFGVDGETLGRIVHPMAIICGSSG